MADSPSLSSPLADRLARLDRALEALDRALDPAADKGSSLGLAQQAALAELQGRVGRLVVHLEKAVTGSGLQTGAKHAAD